MSQSIVFSNQVIDDELLSVETSHGNLLLTRIEGEVIAFANKCPHLGLSLKRGKLENGTIRCPWHGACFELRSGENVEWCNSIVGAPLPKWSHKLIAMGKDPHSLTMFDVVERDGGIFIK